MESNSNVGILAYGSLINDPGVEILPLIVNRIDCKTPFDVEYARISKTRDNAPTLIPVKDGQGSKVKAQILVLNESVTLNEAQNMLWRRETRERDNKKSYSVPKNSNKNAVSIIQLNNYYVISKVIYTLIPSNMGLLNRPDILAHFAIESILSKAGENQLDGIRYLYDAKMNGILTPKTEDYEKFILSKANANTLEEAIKKLDKLRPTNLKFLEELDQFEKQVITVADYAFEYGLKSTVDKLPNDPKEIMELMRSNNEKFLINCHTGFKKAQDLALKLVLEFQDELERNREEIKSLRKSKNIHAAKFLEAANKRILFKENIIRHVIDGIVWQMINGQLYLARRLYQRVNGDKILKHSNLTSVLTVVNDINRVDKDFALISDLSGYIQTGDIFCRRNNGIEIIEVKEGKKNHEILEITHEILSSDKDTKDILNSKGLDKKSVEQIIRQLKQYATMQNVANIFNHDKGIDISSGKLLNIITPDEPTLRYDERLYKIMKQLKTSNLFAYDVIDRCLHIGIYKGAYKFLGKEILKGIAEQKTKNYVIQDIRGVINSLNRPLFFMPFPKEFIFDILFGRISFLMLLDLDAFIELFNELGYKAEWANRKETMRAIESYSKDIYKLDNKGIKITIDNSHEMWLTPGTLSKIFFEFINPSYIVYSTKYFEKKGS